jgi:antitoxin PrlF
MYTYMKYTYPRRETSLMNAVVAERGQVTIPKPLRDRFGLAPHAVVRFEEESGRLILTKVVDQDPVARVTGCLSLRRSTDETIRELRGDA